MSKSHIAVALLALGSLAALPACSSPSYYPQTASVAPASQELAPGMVRQVQTALQQQNLYSGPIDGVWGPQTQSAVQSYQQSHSLTASGQLDSQTLASLNLPAADSTANAAPATQSPDTVRQAQTELRQQGFYKGAVDGVWGPQTQGAVQSFQQSHSLTASGQLDDQTMAALNPQPSTQSSATPNNATATAPTNYPNVPTTPSGSSPAPASPTP